MSPSPEAWAREASASQWRADRQRAETRRDRMVAPVEWVVLVFLAVAVVAVVALNVRL